MNKEFIVKKLTELLIKQEFDDKKKNKQTYVRKTAIYRDLIEFFKEYL